MQKTKLLGVDIKNHSKEYILDKIVKFIHTPYAMLHVVSLNPENLVISMGDQEYQNILSQGDLQLIDGMGIALGCDFLKIPHGARFTGADFMEKLISDPGLEGLRVLFLGAKANIAERLAVCYGQKQPKKSFRGIEGFKNIKSPKSEEVAKILQVIADYKPQIIFAAFGSPAQEKWFDRHKGKLSGIICVGVGGAFDFAIGNIPRAPVLMRRTGFEWLYRLILQPWRIGRQMRLFEFLLRVLWEKVIR